MSRSAVCRSSTLAVTVLITLAVAGGDASASYKVGGQGAMPIIRVDQVCRDGMRFQVEAVAPPDEDPLAPRIRLEDVQARSGDGAALTPKRRLWIPYREVVEPDRALTVGQRPLTLTHSAPFTFRFSELIGPSTSDPTDRLLLDQRYPTAPAFPFLLEVLDCMLVDLQPRVPYPNTLAPRLERARVDFALLSTRAFRADRLRVRSMQASTGEAQWLGWPQTVGGTFTLSFGTQTTEEIASTATPSDVQTALEALPAVGKGNVVVSRDSGWLVAFTGSLSGKDVDLLKVDSPS